MNSTAKRNRARRMAATLLPALLGAALVASGAARAEGTARKEYVATLEALCKPRELAIEQRVGGVRDDVKKGRSKIAGKKFGIAARIFGASVRSIVPVPRPPEDKMSVSKWFRYLNQQEAYMQQISRTLLQGRTIQGQRYIARFVHSGNLANRAVLGFGFNYCAFKFSRFN
jgi:hypothetical protein